MGRRGHWVGILGLVTSWLFHRPVKDPLPQPLHPGHQKHQELSVGCPVIFVNDSVDNEVDGILYPVDHKNGDAECDFTFREKGVDSVHADGNDTHQEQE